MRAEMRTAFPQYSVLMSLYAKEVPEYFELAFESMARQTLMPHEIIVVCDGPLTKGLEETLRKVRNDYPDLLKIVRSESNIGLGLALNLGLQHCSCELVARMDTDDISFPDRAEKQLVAFMEDQTLDLLGSHVSEFVGDVSNVVSMRKVPITHEEIYEFAKRRSAFNHPAVMFKKSSVLSVGGYSDLRRNQDVDLFGRMLFSGCRANNIDESLLYFRSGESLAKRRKSWENTKSYIEVIHNFYRMGYSSFADFALVATAQTFMFLCPAKIQAAIYRAFLR